MSIELWIPITIAAAFLQNLRSVLQKRITGRLSVNGATYVRFCYALPFAWVYALLVLGGNAPPIDVEFLLLCLCGGVAQILGTAFLVGSFRHDNFAVGTAYSKTEVVQAVLVGLVVLGERVDSLQAAGIGVSFLGVLLLSARGRLNDLLRGNRALTLGLMAGTGIAVSVVSYRAAALHLPSGGVLERAALTLAVTLTLQSLVMGAYLGVREPGELRRVLHAWRAAVWVGLVGMVASAGWFTAMTLQNAGLVRALGQVELLFTFAASVWVFRERVSVREVAGALLIVLGLAALVV